MRLRHTLLLLGTLLLSATVLALLALVLLTDWLEESGLRIVRSLEQSQVVSELQLAVSSHRREMVIWTLTGDDAHLRTALDVMGTARERLQMLRHRPALPDRRAAIARVQEALQEYERAVFRADFEPGQPTGEILRDYQETTESLDRLLAATEELQAIYRREAEGARARGERVNRLANLGSVLVGVLLVSATTLFLVRVVRRLYAPLPALQAAMARLRAGDLSARAPVEGPEEFRLVSEGVNTLASELQTQRRERLTFLAAVAHDLRNPLNTLRLLAHLGQGGRPLPPEIEVRRFYGQVARQVDSLNRQVGDLLDLARLEAGEMSFDRQPVDLGDVCRKVVELVAPTTSEHDLVLDLRDVPKVDADPARLEQALINLVSNALKYSPGGGRVEVRLARRAGWAVLEVVDEGIGIAPADLDHLFRPFRRSQEVGGIPGTGLGLSTARRIAEAHGGRIEVESVPGRGSTFRVFLPLA